MTQAQPAHSNQGGWHDLPPALSHLQATDSLTLTTYLATAAPFEKKPAEELSL